MKHREGPEGLCLHTATPHHPARLRLRMQNSSPSLLRGLASRAVTSNRIRPLSPSRKISSKFHLPPSWVQCCSNCRNLPRKPTRQFRPVLAAEASRRQILEV